MCYKAGYIDSWGRGIEKIKDACKQAGRPDPIISEHNGGIEIELIKSKLETTAKVSGKRRESVGKTSGMVLAACRENSSITIPEMSHKIGITERSVQRNIQKLQKDGLLRRVGGRKEGYWEVL